MSRNKESWPSWAPASLVQAYEELSLAPDADWIQDEAFGHALFRLEDTRDYPGVLVGIGEKKETLGVVRSLCADPRMKVPWMRLQEATEAARSAPNPAWVNFAGATDLQVLAVQVAWRTVRLLSATEAKISRAEWTRQLTEVAEHARALADLVEKNASLVDDLNQFGRHYFPDDEWEGACEELAMETPGLDTTPLTADELLRAERQFDAVRNGLDPEPTTKEEEARDAEFMVNFKGWTDWYRGKLDRALHFLSVSGALGILHERASWLSQNPPFVPKGSDDARRLAKLSNWLSHLFIATFGSPLDEVVATIAEVATRQEVSTDSVKMRRKRVRDYYKKGVK